jgi:hypothetical protein
LGPGELDRALVTGCGTQPTIVIVSSCFSGIFAEPPMLRPNRIILTAARPDRASFGCGAGFIYTIFDQCLLGAIDGAADWHTVYDRARRCVAIHEAAMKLLPSEPQANFGALVSAMPGPWHDTAADGGIHFAAGGVRYAPEILPLSKADRERNRTALAAYAGASMPKALALSPDGFFTWEAARPSDGLTPADVKRLALQRCEWSGGPCILYVVDDRVIAPLPSGLAPFHPPLLARSGLVEPATVPFIRDDQRSIVADYLRLAGPKALALGRERPVIAYAEASSIEAARTEALSKCQATTRYCVLYAQDQRIVLEGAP